MSRQGARDRLASPTMAQIYMRQGHYHRARETLDAVLEADPFAGAALVLRERLAILDGPALHARGDGRTLELRWQAAPPSGAHLLVIAFRGRSIYVTSRPCAAADGRLTLELPPPHRPGSASVCLAEIGERGEPRILAVAEPLTWGST
ncbi:MAG: hypothetical protein H6710_18850 [Myxococcales bacterium]|nr:hypothetical protein [Myxococcales bacterium]MCB9706112.1 hypothetical protein [Myxococcales bacterium]